MTDGGTRPSARILVVDDDRGLRDVLRFALSTGGWQVALAENAQHGLSRLAATVPTRSSWTSACPTWTGSRSAAGSAARATGCRC